MTDPALIEKYRQTPHAPGVYLMKDAKAKIVYVGKANDLKKRLSSYFIRKSRPDAKTAVLLSMVRDFDLVLTSSGHEAFILESTLIKEHSPKYNVILKDGKNYPLLRIDMNEDYPAITRVRKIAKDNALYFGPYSSSGSVNRTLIRLQRIFRLRQCKNTQFKNRARPCLNYQIKTCLGLCCNDISSMEYKKQVQAAVLFLKGKTKEVLEDMNRQMKSHSDALEFEKAARIRDTIAAIKNIMEKQVVVSSDLKDRDIIARAWDKGKIVITVMMVRSGYLMDTAHYYFELGFKEPEELVSSFLEDYYSKLSALPSYILLDNPLENIDLLSQNLKKRFPEKKKLSIHVPIRGEKKRLVDMAGINARQELEKQLLKEEEEQAALVMLKNLLRMEKAPDRIECFDNSSLAGHEAVSAMVVFKDGRPWKQGYRKYILKDMNIPDDYAAMYQALGRRFAKTKEKAKESEYPDLLVVDGGKGQLGIAVAVLKGLGIDGQFRVIGIAKKDAAKGETADKIYIPGRQNPLNTTNAVKALYLLQRVRDEAHRFVITFQRTRREKNAKISLLDTVAGIGPKKKKMLLQHFKGISRMKNAEIEEISALPGMTVKLSQNLLTALNRTDS